MEYELQNWPAGADGEPEQAAMLLSGADVPGDVSILCSMLESFGIPYYIDRPGLGGYLNLMLGRTVTAGLELYVPASRLAEARALLDAPAGLDEEDFPPEEP